MNKPNTSGSAEGSFPTMKAAVEFAVPWLDLGWTAELTNPGGDVLRLVKGEAPKFPRRSRAGR